MLPGRSDIFVRDTGAQIAERVEASNFNCTSIASRAAVWRRGVVIGYQAYSGSAWTFSGDRRQEGRVQRLGPLPNGDEGPEIEAMHERDAGQGGREGFPVRSDWARPE